MIDIENELFTTIATALRSAFDGIFVSGEYVSQPPQFPAVSIVEMDNSTYQPAADNGDVDNASTVMYQVDVYSNKSTGKKAQARAIAAQIDRMFTRRRFLRTFKNPIPNANDATIYRITARYRRNIANDDNL